MTFFAQFHRCRHMAGMYLLSASIVGSSAYVGAILNQMRRDQRQAFETAERREFESLMKRANAMWPICWAMKKAGAR